MANAQQPDDGSSAWLNAKKKRGTALKVAKALGISHVAVGGWKRVPADRVKKVADVLRVSRRSLRPDLY